MCARGRQNDPSVPTTFANHELLQPLLILAGARNGMNQLRSPYCLESRDALLLSRRQVGYWPDTRLAMEGNRFRIQHAMSTLAIAACSAGVSAALKALSVAI
jgi:hypothetical protein